MCLKTSILRPPAIWRLTLKSIFAQPGLESVNDDEIWSCFEKIFLYQNSVDNGVKCTTSPSYSS